MGADTDTTITSGTGLTNLLNILRIAGTTDLTVGTDAIDIGTMTEKASY